MGISIQFLRGARQAAGSKHILTTPNNTRKLLDRGLFQGSEPEEMLQNPSYQNPKEVENLFIVHGEAKAQAAIIDRPSTEDLHPMLRILLLSSLSLLLSACGASTEENSQTSSLSEASSQAKRRGQKAGSEKGNGQGVIRCFAYHRFGNDSYPSTNISLDRFKAHLEFLDKNDYQVLTLGKALDRMQKGDLKGNNAVLTMDDGYASIMSGAVPLLKKYGYKATIFVCTEYVGSKNNLSWKELEELEKKGFEIGNHSHSHAHFLNASSDSLGDRFEKDLERSEARFKAHLGKKPELYAYPYGEYVPEMERILEKKGYEGAVAQNSGVIARNSDPYSLPRFPMTSFYGKPEKFREKARMLPLPVLKEEPRSPLLEGKDRPTLRLTLGTERIDKDGLQCFIDGTSNCSMERTRKGGRIILHIRSKKALQERRTLYTITAPGPKGNWHWYSKLWVRPEKGE